MENFLLSFWNIFQIIFYTLTTFFCLYVGARLIFSAYFRSKEDYVVGFFRRNKNGNWKETD